MPLIAVGGGNGRRDPPRQRNGGPPRGTDRTCIPGTGGLAPGGSVACFQSQACRSGRPWDRPGRWPPDIARGTARADDHSECPVRDGCWPASRHRWRGACAVSLGPRRAHRRVRPGDRSGSPRCRGFVPGRPPRHPLWHRRLRPGPRAPSPPGAPAARLRCSDWTGRGAATGLDAECRSAAATDRFGDDRSRRRRAWRSSSPGQLRPRRSWGRTACRPRAGSRSWRRFASAGWTRPS